MASNFPQTFSLRFFREYCRNVRDIGSIVPDSSACVSALLRGVPFASAGVIVEFGSASGAVTREIIKRKKPGTLFISFEKNVNLHRSLQETIKGENVFLVNDNALNTRKVLSDVFGIGERGVDCVISTLPCSCFDFDGLVRESVLPLLKENGRFIQYMHTLSRLKGFDLDKVLRKYFTGREADLVLLNIPPALVYTCHNVGPSK
jgi:phosphatidylethanolamine/phosphatidyl-N-methylethanolamine N-methyltransferase